MIGPNSKAPRSSGTIRHGAVPASSQSRDASDAVDPLPRSMTVPCTGSPEVSTNKPDIEPPAISTLDACELPTNGMEKPWFNSIRVPSSNTTVRS